MRALHHCRAKPTRYQRAGSRLRTLPAANPTARCCRRTSGLRVLSLLGQPSALPASYSPATLFTSTSCFGGRKLPFIQPMTTGDVSGSREHSIDEQGLSPILCQASNLNRGRLPHSGQRFHRRHPGIRMMACAVALGCAKPICIAQHLREIGI